MGYNIKEALQRDYPDAQITKYFIEVNKQDWFKYLNGARNRVEHGQILMLEFRGDTGKMVIADKQDVGIESTTTVNRYEPATWCQNIFDETCRFVDTCSQDLNSLLYP
jgi:hypothetical protein